MTLLGRMDRQIKIRGCRVELDEIEAAICSHDRVEESAVYAVADGHGTRRIEAAVICKVSSLEHELNSAQLNEYVRSLVPAYAVPERFWLLNEFPRTTSGKIDRRRLQEDAPMSV